MANIAIIGTGYAGSVTGACLADFGNFVTCVDNNRDKIEALKKGIIPIYEPGLDAIVSRNIQAGRLSFSTDAEQAITANDVIFIAVGTPPKEDGSADLDYVEAVARQIGRTIASYKTVVTKSTVPVGSNRLVERWILEEQKKRGVSIPFDAVSNPEFLREGAAVQDFTHPDRIVIGSGSAKARQIMKDVYRALYLNETPYIETSLETAEMIKYATNAFLAVKISFINEIANLCEKTGADVQDVARAMGRDGRIGSKFLHPGPGYGGSCFPKDTRALARTGRNCGEPITLVEAAIAANEGQKKRQAEKIEKAMGGSGSLKGKTITVLGLSYKPNTDDTRESPALVLCEALVKKGAKLRVFDPIAMKEASWRLEGVKDSVYFASNEYDALAGSSALAIVTEWNQFRTLDLNRVRESLGASPYFFDLRNIYKREGVEAAGLKYYGTGKQ